MLKAIGTIIALICVIFIFKMIISIDMDWSIVGRKQLVIMIILGLLGATSIYLVAYVWSLLLKFIEDINVRNSELAYIYIKANIAKYLPGNIMNLVGRNVLAGKLGFKQANIAISTLIEIGLFAITTMLLAIVFSMKQIGQFYMVFKTYTNYKVLMIVIICMGVVGMVALCLILKKSKYAFEIKKYFTLDFVKICLKAVGLYSIYFIFSGVILVIILNQVLSVAIDANMVFQIIGFYVISYFIGYITPGAPGGMGVREAVLILLLTTVVGSDIATVASVIHRVITVFADLCIYTINHFIIYKKRIEQSDRL